MFGMSVNEVPGWLVAMAPSGIGVPVAATPGLVPHCDVLTVAAPAELDEAPAGVVDDPAAVLLLLLLQPAAPRARRRRRARSFFACGAHVARECAFSSIPLRAVSCLNSRSRRS